VHDVLHVEENWVNFTAGAFRPIPFDGTTTKFIDIGLLSNVD